MSPPRQIRPNGDQSSASRLALPIFAIVPLLVACAPDSLTTLSASEASAEAAKSSPSSSASPEFKCDANDQIIDYHADYPDLPGGPSTPEAGLAQFRNDQPVHGLERPARSYFGTPRRQSTTPADRKTFDFERPDGGKRMHATVEQIGDSWHLTSLSGCRSWLVGERRD